jgi:hypothetical protein
MLATRLLHAPRADLEVDLVVALLSGLAADVARDRGPVTTVPANRCLQLDQLGLAPCPSPVLLFLRFLYQLSSCCWSLSGLDGICGSGLGVLELFAAVCRSRVARGNKRVYEDLRDVADDDGYGDEAGT